MADLGAVGHIVPGCLTLAVTDRFYPVFFTGVADLSSLYDWFERDNSDGMPAAPCMVQRRRGTLRPPVAPPWPVDPGTRTLRIWCKHSGHAPYPRVIVRPNDALGVAQAEAVANALTGWQELVVTVAPTAKGALEIWLEVRAVETSAWAKWDHVSAS